MLPRNGNYLKNFPCYYEQISPYSTIKECPTSLYDCLDETFPKATLLLAHQPKKDF